MQYLNLAPVIFLLTVCITSTFINDVRKKFERDHTTSATGIYDNNCSSILKPDGTSVFVQMANIDRLRMRHLDKKRVNLLGDVTETNESMGIGLCQDLKHDFIVLTSTLYDVRSDRKVMLRDAFKSSHPWMVMFDDLYTLAMPCFLVTTFMLLCLARLGLNESELSVCAVLIVMHYSVYTFYGLYDHIHN
jgi:hypothetical protein